MSYVGKDLVMKAIEGYRKSHEDGYVRVIVRGAYGIVDKIPDADVEPIKHGKWIYNDAIGAYDCSECGRGNWVKGDNYCFNCGAKMDKKVEE